MLKRSDHLPYKPNSERALPKGTITTKVNETTFNGKYARGKLWMRQVYRRLTMFEQNVTKKTQTPPNR
jgi:hypothetical protein